MCQNCPQLIFKQDDTLALFVGWYRHTLDQERPKIIINAGKAMTNLYIQLDALAQIPEHSNLKSVMNGHFVNILNESIKKILEKSMIQKGFVTPLMDSVNDIVQYCDCINLRSQLYELASQVV